MRIARNTAGLYGSAGTEGHECRADRHSQQDRDKSNAQLPANPRSWRKVAELWVNVVRERHCELLSAFILCSAVDQKNRLVAEPVAQWHAEDSGFHHWPASIGSHCAAALTIAAVCRAIINSSFVGITHTDILLSGLEMSGPWFSLASPPRMGWRSEGSLPLASAKSTASAHENNLDCGLSARLVRITGTRAPVTAPAASAPAMNVSSLYIM